MLAVDTNLIVRYLVSDDPIQSERAKLLIDSEDVYILLSVLLETEWVLRDVYDFSRRDIADAFGRLVGLPTVQLEHPARTRQALEWLADGLDFADALHLAGTSHCTAFLTYDKAFIKAAKGVFSIPVRTP